MENIRSGFVYKIPKYSKIPNLEIGQTVDALVKIEGHLYASRVKRIHGVIISKNKYMITIQTGKYKESIALVDFKTNCASLV